MSAPLNPRIVRNVSERSSASELQSSLADAYGGLLSEDEMLDDVDEFEDTQPSILLPDAIDDDDEFTDAPTIPGFRLHADGRLERVGGHFDSVRDGQWDRVLRAVAVAVKRVFATHSLE